MAFDTKLPVQGMSDESIAPSINYTNPGVSEEVPTTREERWGKLLKFGAPAALAGMVDTLGQSIGVVDDDAVENTLQQIWPTFGDYYSRNKEAARVAGDLLLFVPAGMAGLKMLQGVKYATKFLGFGDSLAAKTLLTSSKEYSTLMRGLRARDRYLARRRGLWAGRDFVKDLTRQQFKKRVWRVGMTDSLKKSIAFEMGLYSFMNQSDFIFPEEFSVSDNLLLSAGGIALGVGAEAAFLRKAIRNSVRDAMRSTYPKWAQNLGYEETMRNLIFRGPTSEELESYRGHGVTLLTTLRETMKEIRNQTQDKILRNNLDADLGLLDSRINDNLKKFFTDNLKGLKGEAGDVGHFQTITDTLAVDPLFPLALQRLTKMPKTKKELESTLKSVAEAYKGELEKHNARVMEAAAKIKKLGGQPMDDPSFRELIRQGQELSKKSMFHQNLDAFVVEPGGELSLAATRRPRFEDQVDPGFKHTTIKGTGGEPNIYMVEVNKRKVGVNADGQAIIAPREVDTEFNRSYSTNIVPPKGQVIDETIFPRRTSETITQFAHVWHAEYGQLGRQATKSLSDDVHRALYKWASGHEMKTDRGPIKTWFREDTQEARQIIAAFEPMRKALRELRDSYDNTVGLYRGESKSAFKSPRSDIASYSTDREVARRFGEQLVYRRVPIDDILFVTGLEGELEFVVRNNKIRTPNVRPVTVENFSQANFDERSAIFYTYRKRVENFDKGKNQLYVYPDEHWTKLNYALALKEKYGEVPNVMKRIDISAFDNDWSKVEWAAVAGQYRDFLAQWKLRDQLLKGALKLGKHPDLPSFEDIRYMVNLPSDTYGQTHPLVELFEKFAQSGFSELSAAVKNLDHLSRMMQETVTLPELFPYAGITEKLRGNNFLPQKGKPVLAFKRPVNLLEETRETVIEQMAIRRLSVLEAFSKANLVGATFVKGVAEEITKHQSAYREAQDVASLAWGMERGKGRALQQAFSMDTSPAYNALNHIMVLADRYAEKAIETMLKPHIDNFNKIRGTNQAADLFEFNLYTQSNRAGWRIEEAVERDNGRVAFRLEQSPFNQRLWKKFYKTDMPTTEDGGAFLPRMTAKDLDNPVDLEVGDLAYKVIRSFDDLSTTILHNANFLRKQTGLSQLNKRPYHLPPGKLDSNTSVFLFRKDGSYKNVFTGRTRAESERMAEQAMQEGDVKRTFDSIKRFKEASILDEPFFKPVDWSDTALQTGKGPTGAMYKSVVDLGAQPLNDMVSSITNQLYLLARRTRGLVFEPQWNFAKFAHSANGFPEHEMSPWIFYNNAIFGNQALTPRGTLGQVYKGIENFYDTHIAALWDKYAVSTARGERGRGGASSFRELMGGNKREYDRIAKELGPHMPFKDTAEFVENTFRVSMPPSMKRHAAKLNQIASLLTLRLMELGHPILNMTSLAATIPPVMKALKRLPNEDVEIWRNRIGAFGSTVTDNVAMYSPMRSVADAVSFMFTEEGHKIWREAARKGWFKQEVAELMHTLTRPQEGYAESLVSKYTDILSFLSDRSEELARAISFMMGYRIGQRGLGFTNPDDLGAFAFSFANKVIGDYRPVNRPQMFQGAVGMPLGLFQTFMWNYMQRVFSYIENRQWRALAVQYGMQASVFGGLSVPGMDQFVNMFATASDGSANIVDGARRIFGDGLTDVMFYGAISTIPKIFSDDGIALYTRGAIDPKLSTVLNPENTPVGNMIGNAIQFARKSLGQFLTGGQFSLQQQMELAGAYSISRPLRGLMELAAGVSTDKRGQVITNEVYDTMSIIARIVGSRTLSETERSSAYYRQRNAEFSQTAIRQRMNSALRALVRDGKFNEETFANYAYSYIKAGNNPRYFGQALRDAIIAAVVPRDRRKLMEVLRSGRGEEIQRLMGSLVMSKDDPEFNLQ